MGEWLKRNGETIYGTRGGPIPAQKWGVTTRKEDKVYVHLLQSEDEYLDLPGMAALRKASFYADGSPVEIQKTEHGLRLRVPQAKRNAIDTIIVLKLKNR
jgi:alpha-L-fucosidase